MIKKNTFINKNNKKKIHGRLALLLLTAAMLVIPAQVRADDGEDYILGRPMTEEEIAEQQEQEPEELTEFPELDITLPESDSVSANTSSLPSSYDARTDSLMTSVKNQLPYGTCWAFSAISSAETSLINNGVSVNGTTATASNLDLSELQLLYFFYHSVTDCLGGTAGDSTTALTSDYLNQGGNGIFTTFALASWVGVTTESKADYDDASVSLALSDSLARDADVAHMQDAYWFSLTDVGTVKQMVADYGNVSIAFYWSDSNYNYSTGGYYQSTYSSTNHAVNIVGWDDDYSKENFNTSPSSDGAWLVKNNWGSDWGDEGYFWISYEELSLTGTNAFGFVYEFESSDNYDYNYQYDGSYGYHRYAVTSGSSVANVFTVSGSSYEKLRAVSLACYSTDVTYSLQIYKNPDSGDPESGTAQLDTPQTGTISYTGYVTIPLEQTDVVFAKGDTFSVVFTLKSSDGAAVQVFMDESYTNGNWVTFVNDTEIGQSYAEQSGSWTDLGMNSKGKSLGTDGQTIRIKAFTDSTSAVPVTKVTLNKTSLSLTVGKTSTLKATHTPTRTTDSETVTWSSSDTSVATVSSAGKVTAKGVGTAKITAKIGSKKATCTVTVSLAAPTLKKAAATGYKKIKVTWKSVTGASGYRIYRKTSGGSWSRVATVSGKSTVSYTDTVPSDSKKYIYTVKAYTKSSGSTVWSSYDKTGVSAKAVPTTPTLTKIAVSTNGVRITWEKSPPSGYRIYRNTGSGSWTRVKTITDKSTVTWLDTSLTAGKTYTYTVKAYFASGSKRTYSSYDKTGLTATVTPKKVTLTDVTAAKKGNTITWKAVNCDGYRIYRKTSGGKWTKIAAVKGKSTTSYTDATAASGKTYSYKVKAYYTFGNKTSCGTCASSMTVTSWSLATPALKTAKAAGTKKIKLTWKSVSGASGYRIYRKTSGGSYSRVATVSGKSTVSYTDTVPSSKKTYTYTVKAYYKRGTTTVWSSCDKTGLSAQAGS
ncbi:MAG: lectin like domain-containing protein [Lachnospiraceae bacterium]|nr:lectin like domain-containing protein [Lachnospiraceae bacterium]